MSENVLTITIAGRDEDIDVRAFLSVVKNAVSILSDLDRTSVADSSRLNWVVTHVSKSSPLKMRMAGVERGGGSTYRGVVGKFLAGMRSLESGEHRPEDFTDTMMDRALNIVRPLNNSVASVVFSDEDTEPVAVTQHVAANVSRFRLPDTYAEFSELEGELGQISAHKAPYQFCIYDPLTDKGIPCVFDEEDFENVRDALKERIRVTGLVTYKRNTDSPTLVLVDDWLKLPKGDELVSIEQLHAADISLTHGRKSEEVIAELRRVNG